LVQEDIDFIRILGLYHVQSRQLWSPGGDGSVEVDAGEAPPAVPPQELKEPLSPVFLYRVEDIAKLDDVFAPATITDVDALIAVRRNEDVGSVKGQTQRHAEHRQDEFHHEDDI